uniref:Uncharacterized protein n=1 Tax=Anguilla anguilla TaxID=7936 RepID=A0A0E9UZU5_ANGAN
MSRHRKQTLTNCINIQVQFVLSEGKGAHNLLVPNWLLTVNYTLL